MFAYILFKYIGINGVGPLRGPMMPNAGQNVAL